MKISYAITVCNEFEEIKTLLSFLQINKREEDEICVLLDKPKASQELIDFLCLASSNGFIILQQSAFNNHFANWKNELNSLCSGDYIFQIDADELPNKDLIDNLPPILEINSEVDIFLVPRINTVDGLTSNHINQWRWNVNDKGWVNFPDYQWRIYRNSSNIKWKNKVHEVLEGFKVSTLFPSEEEYCLYHPKTIERQEKQNNYYSKL